MNISSICNCEFFISINDNENIEKLYNKIDTEVKLLILIFFKINFFLKNEIIIDESGYYQGLMEIS